MTADTENETGAPKRRGRIPQSAWPQILERYKSGATLSAIAREFDCTPSAISYIVRKAEKSEGVGDDLDEQVPVEAPAKQPESKPAAAAAPVTAESPAPANTVPPPESHRAEDARGNHARPEQARPDQGGPEQERDPREGLRREGRSRLEIGGRPQNPDANNRADQRGDRQDPRGERGPRFGQGRPERNGPERNGQERGPDRGQDRGPDRGGRLGADRLSNDRPERNGISRPDPAEQPDYRHDQGGERFGGDQGYPYHRQRTNPARQEAQETPTVPADLRMEAAAKASADLYRTWKEKPGEESHQALADSLHEMRKVIARMEIEMSASRKDEQRPIPQSYRIHQRAPQQPRG